MPNPKEFAQWLATKIQDLKAYAKRRGKCSADADDFAQEVAKRMWEIQKREKIENVQAYLFAVARNLEQEIQRDSKRHHVLLQAYESEYWLLKLANAVDVDHEHDFQTNQKILSEAFGRLTQEDQEVLTMRYGEEMSYPDMSLQKGWKSKTTAGNKLQRAITRLRAEFKTLRKS